MSGMSEKDLAWVREVATRLYVGGVYPGVTTAVSELMIPREAYESAFNFVQDCLKLEAELIRPKAGEWQQKSSGYVREYKPEEWAAQVIPLRSDQFEWYVYSPDGKEMLGSNVASSLEEAMEASSQCLRESHYL